MIKEIVINRARKSFRQEIEAQKGSVGLCYKMIDSGVLMFVWLTWDCAQLHTYLCILQTIHRKGNKKHDSGEENLLKSMCERSSQSLWIYMLWKHCATISTFYSTRSTWEKATGIDTETKRSNVCRFAPHKQGLGQTEANSWELKPDLPHGQWRLTCLNQHLLPPAAHIRRKLKSGNGAGNWNDVHMFEMQAS